MQTHTRTQAHTHTRIPGLKLTKLNTEQNIICKVPFWKEVQMKYYEQKEGLSFSLLLERERKNIDPVYNCIRNKFSYQTMVISTLQASATEKSRILWTVLSSSFSWNFNSWHEAVMHLITQLFSLFGRYSWKLKTIRTNPLPGSIFVDYLDLGVRLRPICLSGLKRFAPRRLWTLLVTLLCHEKIRHCTLLVVTVFKIGREENKRGKNSR